MSVVVAIKDKDRIWMGCDSQVTYGGTKETLPKTNTKIWKPSDDKNIVMGGVGYLRDINILSTTTEWVDELAKLKNEINFKFMVRNFVPKMFKELDTFGRLGNDKGFKYMNSNFIFAYKDTAFQIGGSGEVSEIKDVLTDGSGFIAALGAWESIKNNDNLTVKEKLTEMVKASCERDLYVYYPIIIMNTLDDEVEVIDKPLKN